MAGAAPLRPAAAADTRTAVLVRLTPPAAPTPARPVPQADPPDAELLRAETAAAYAAAHVLRLTRAGDNEPSPGVARLLGHLRREHLRHVYLLRRRCRHAGRGPVKITGDDLRWPGLVVRVAGTWGVRPVLLGLLEIEESLLSTHTRLAGELAGPDLLLVEGLLLPATRRHVRRLRAMVRRLQ